MQIVSIAIGDKLHDMSNPVFWRGGGGGGGGRKIFQNVVYWKFKQACYLLMSGKQYGHLSGIINWVYTVYSGLSNQITQVTTIDFFLLFIRKTLLWEYI